MLTFDSLQGGCHFPLGSLREDHLNSHHIEGDSKKFKYYTLDVF